MTDAELQALRERVEKASAFKRWVHEYLDAHGVPHHPPGTHGAAGCRIGDRMDWLMAKLAAAEAEGESLRRVLAEVERLRSENARLEERLAALTRVCAHGYENSDYCSQCHP